MIKILVIENTPKHLKDAKVFFSNMEGYEFTYTESLCEAISLNGDEYEAICDRWGEEATLFQRLSRYDGIITDINFPNYSNRTKGIGSGIDAPIGVAIILFANLNNIPCVGITDTYHHSNSMQWATTFLRMAFQRDTFLDTERNDIEEGKKPWAAAFKELIKLFKR